MVKDNKQNVLAELQRLLEYHRLLGITTYPGTDGIASLLKAPGRRPQPIALQPQKEAAPHFSSKKKSVTPPSEPTPRRTTLPEIRADLGDCQRCTLAASRNNIVFGEGAVNGSLFLVADAPSMEDDGAGTPFNGEAGGLLDKMLGAIKMSRKDIYVTSLVKCIVPEGQTSAKPDEIGSCLPFLLRQIETVNPIIVCAMGPLSARTLLGIDQPLIRLRGKLQPLRAGNVTKKTLVLPTFHPAFLLTNPEMKKASWEDLQLIRRTLHEKRP